MIKTRKIQMKNWMVGMPLITAVVMIGYTNCSKGFSSISAGGTSAAAFAGNITLNNPGSNTLPVTIDNFNGSLNVPFISVTVCVPGTNNCAVVPHVLLDMGSSGVRIFSSALPSNFESELTGGTAAECLSYGSNNVQWGPVKKADVKLGQEIAHSVPIEVVDTSYGDGGKQCYTDLANFYAQQGWVNSASDCSTSTTATQSQDSSSKSYGCPFFDSAAASGINGIVGVNFLEQDCGSACATNAQNGLYYNCSSGTCSSAAMPIASQISNPIGFFATDNNGLILQLPYLATGYSSSVTGEATFGIGTESNNSPGRGVTTLAADSNDTDTCWTSIQTRWNSGSSTNTICGFIDSGSGTFNFPYTNSNVLPVDTVNYNLFVPVSPQNLSAVNVGYNGVTSTVAFTIQNMESYVNNYSAIADIGTQAQNGPINGEFDWGLPFFYGRTVYIGLENKSSPLGSGLYWAY